MKDKFIKNGVFSLEYDKETLRDMVLELQEENQELKLELSGYRQAILEDKDMLGLKEENTELKKQLTTYQILHRDCKVDNLKNISKIEEMENQQKKFIEYLENEIYSIEPKGTGINYNCEYDSEEDCIMAMQEQSRLNTLKEILQKYKSIIGVIK